MATQVPSDVRLPVTPGTPQTKDEAPVTPGPQPAFAIYRPSIGGFSPAEAEWLNQLAVRNAASPLRNATLNFRPADGTIFQYIGYAGGGGGQAFKDQNILPTGNVYAVMARWGDYMN